MNDSSTNKVPFVIQLIDELKRHGFISSSIMLPLLIGAYKVKENYQGENYLDFIQHTYNDIIESLYKHGRHLYFRECEASHNFVIEPVTEKPQKCNATILYKETPVIYCNDATLGDGCKKDAKDMQTYFLNKLLKQTVKYCNFNDTINDIKDFTAGMHMLNENKYSELDIIKSIL